MAALAAWRHVNFLEIEAMSLNLGLRTPRMSKVIAPTPAERQKLLVDNPLRLYRFKGP